jgi:hypothetical protein
MYLRKRNESRLNSVFIDSIIGEIEFHLMKKGKEYIYGEDRSLVLNMLNWRHLLDI